jgi:mono/diheme cytochrome c family protein
MKIGVFVVFALLALGCRQPMGEQPRYDPLEPSRFFSDGQSVRRPVPGTVARGHLRDDPHYFTGRKSDTPAEKDGAAKQGPSLDRAADYADTFPLPVTSALMQRGQQRFTIYCTSCHGRDGAGTGVVVERGYPKASSFHTDRLRQAPAGYLFDVVSRGYGAMPAFAGQIPSQDRWAIIAYVRALQLSQHASLKELPAEIRWHFTEKEDSR